jgi:hypothetical protein
LCAGERIERLGDRVIGRLKTWAAVGTGRELLVDFRNSKLRSKE